MPLLVGLVEEVLHRSPPLPGAGPWRCRPADRLIERGAHSAVDLVRRSGSAAGFLHVLVEALQVLGLQLGEAVCADAGDEVVVDRDKVAVGATTVFEAERLQGHWRRLFPRPVSDSTLRRTLEAIDAPVAARIEHIRATIRRVVWTLLVLRPGGFPWIAVCGRELTGWYVLDLDATIVTCTGKKEGAAGTFKGRCDLWFPPVDIPLGYGQWGLSTTTDRIGQPAREPLSMSRSRHSARIRLSLPRGITRPPPTTERDAAPMVYLSVTGKCVRVPGRGGAPAVTPRRTVRGLLSARSARRLVRGDLFGRGDGGCSSRARRVRRC
jgi:hypothetical protein